MTNDDRDAPYVPGEFDTAPIPDDVVSPVPLDEPVIAPPETTSRRFDPRSEWFWPLVTLIGVAAVIFVNWLANALPFNDQTTGEVLTRDPVWFQPAGWAFAIWGLIYALLVAFAVYGLLPSGRRNPVMRRIAPFLLIANVANMVWLVCWHWEYFTASLITMAILLVALIVIRVLLQADARAARNRAAGWQNDAGSTVSRFERWLVWPLFSIYLGWIGVASLANLMVWWDRTGQSAGPLSLRMWTVVALVGGGIVCYVLAVIGRDGWYAAVFAFAGVAIGMEQWDRSRLVSTVAWLMALLEILMVGIAIMIHTDRKPSMPRFSRRQTAVTDDTISP